MMVQGVQPQHRLLGVLFLKIFSMLFTPFKSVFACFPLVLGYFNNLVVVVLFVFEGAVITV